MANETVKRLKLIQQWTTHGGSISIHEPDAEALCTAIKALVLLPELVRCINDFAYDYIKSLHEEDGFYKQCRCCNGIGRHIEHCEINELIQRAKELMGE